MLHNSLESPIMSEYLNIIRAWEAGNKKSLDSDVGLIDQIETNIKNNLSKSKPACRVSDLENYTVHTMKLKTHTRIQNELEVVKNDISSIDSKTKSDELIASLSYLRAMTMLDDTKFYLNNFKPILKKIPDIQPVADHSSLITFKKCSPTEEDVIQTTLELEEKLNLKNKTLEVILMDSEVYKSKIILIESNKQQQKELESQQQNIQNSNNFVPPPEPQPKPQPQRPRAHDSIQPSDVDIEEHLESGLEFMETPDISGETQQIQHTDGYKSPYKLKFGKK